ncbi:MAG: acyltransferase [Kiritimatiellae bacterium]|nr:acyltransferase [Kiritimatiellia bacterium]
MSLKDLLSRSQKSHILRVCYSPLFMRDIIFCIYKGLKWSPTWRLWRLPLISCKGKGSKIEIGENFTACSDPKHNSLGVIQRVTIKTVGHGALITLGDRVGISGCTITAARSIIIGDHVLIGSGALITDNDAHPISPDDRRLGCAGISKPIVIEDDVFIGARAIVLKGVTIGKGSVIGAGAVVSKSVPPYSICVGNPAKVVGDVRS